MQGEGKSDVMNNRSNNNADTHGADANNSDTRKTLILTGASRGIGHATVQ